MEHIEYVVANADGEIQETLEFRDLTEADDYACKHGLKVMERVYEWSEDRSLGDRYDFTADGPIDDGDDGDEPPADDIEEILEHIREAAGTAFEDMGQRLEAIHHLGEPSLELKVEAYGLVGGWVKDIAEWAEVLSQRVHGYRCEAERAQEHARVADKKLIRAMASNALLGHALNPFHALADAWLESGKDAALTLELQDTADNDAPFIRNDDKVVVSTKDLVNAIRARDDLKPFITFPEPVPYSHIGSAVADQLYGLGFLSGASRLDTSSMFKAEMAALHALGDMKRTIRRVASTLRWFLGDRKGVEDWGEMLESEEVLQQLFVWARTNCERLTPLRNRERMRRERRNFYGLGSSTPAGETAEVRSELDRDLAEFAAFLEQYKLSQLAPAQTVRIDADTPLPVDPDGETTESAQLALGVFFDAEVTDADSVADALSKLLETAMSTPGILEEYGNPVVGGFVVSP